MISTLDLGYFIICIKGSKYICFDKSNYKSWWKYKKDTAQIDISHKTLGATGTRDTQKSSLVKLHSQRFTTPFSHSVAYENYSFFFFSFTSPFAHSISFNIPLGQLVALLARTLMPKVLLYITVSVLEPHALMPLIRYFTFEVIRPPKLQ